MPSFRYQIVNVFAESSLSGNPLCVFESGLPFDDAAMQSIARQMNHPETAFVLPSRVADAQIRIFTPAYEMPFAGHPLLGAAHVIRQLQQTENALKIETKAGVVQVWAEEDVWSFQCKTPTYRAPEANIQQLATLLGIRESDIGPSPLFVNTGTEQLVIQLTNRDGLMYCRPSCGRLAAICRQSQWRRAGVHLGARWRIGTPAAFFTWIGARWSKITAPARPVLTLAAGFLPMARHGPCRWKCARGT
jgi:trans-2,3-dihydro-3-hydroxyanthranilate isomerase